MGWGVFYVETVAVSDYCDIRFRCCRNDCCSS